MIGAHQAMGTAGCFGANQRSAMATDVVQTADKSILAADDNQGIRVYGKRDKVARVGHFAGMRGKKPAKSPDGFDILMIHIAIGIKCSWKRPAGAILSSEGVEDVLFKYVCGSRTTISGL